MSIFYVSCRFLLFSIILSSLAKLFITRIFLYIFLESFLSTTILTISWWRCVLYRNQSIDLLSKLMEWFLYDRDLHHERVNHSSGIIRMRILNWLRCWYFHSSGRNALSKMTKINKKIISKTREWSWTNSSVKSTIWKKK